jgi:hypothetical protein
MNSKHNETRNSEHVKKSAWRQKITLAAITGAVRALVTCALDHLR